MWKVSRRLEVIIPSELAQAYIPDWQTPEYSTFARTSFFPGTGTGQSLRISSGPPSFSTTAAR